MEPLRLFVPFSKVDKAQRTVYGVATGEQVDLAGEVCDYDTTKPLYQKWSAGFATATAGKSLGNLRSMHNKIAAGKVTAINFNDANKTIEIAAKVVDDAEWDKVEQGVYTGFSQGGRYVKRWADPASPLLTRYTADPAEVSLVDMPCLPGATFSMVKVDGVVEDCAFKHVLPEPSTTALGLKCDELRKAAGKPKGEWAAFADDARRLLIAEEFKAELAKLPAPSQTTNSSGVGDGPSQTTNESGLATTAQLANSTAAVTTTEDKGAEDADSRIKEGEAAAAAPISDTDSEWVEPVQTWKCNHHDHKHVAKGDAVRCLKADLSKRKIDALTAPIDATITSINQALGIEGETDAEKRAFTAQQRKKMAESGEAMADGSFPIKSKKDVENAVKDWGRTGSKADVKTHIKARAKALGCEDCLPADWTKKAVAAADVTKGMSEVARFADILESLSWLQARCARETEREGDGSTVAASIFEQARGLAATLVAMAAEEVGELFPAPGENEQPTMETDYPIYAAAGLTYADLGNLAKLPSLAKALPLIEPHVDILSDAQIEALRKRGARNNKSDSARVQKVHDVSCELGADCAATAGKTAEAELTKFATMEHENTLLKGRVEELGTMLVGINTKLQEIAAQPAASRVAIRAVTKGQETAASTTTETKALDPKDPKAIEAMLKGLPEQERVKLLMKMALANPQQIGGHRP